MVVLIKKEYVRKYFNQYYALFQMKADHLIMPRQRCFEYERVQKEVPASFHLTRVLVW